MMSASLREELILTHMPQVEFLARRLHRRCPQVELDDLISVDTIGLIQAVDRFDPALQSQAQNICRAPHLRSICWTTCVRSILCHEMFAASRNNATP